MAWEDVQEPESVAPKIGKFILPNDWHQALLDASERHGVDPHFAQAVMAVESNYKPSATSKKGAMGLMQLMPDTARAMGVQDPYNPIQNIEGGVKLLGQLSQRFNGDLQKVAWVYNAGSLGKSNPETQAYVPAVMAAYRQARGQGTPQQQGQWVDIEETSQTKPQPGKVQSIPKMIGPALTDVTSESLGMFQPKEGLMALGQQVAPQLPMTGMMIGGQVAGLPGATAGGAIGKVGEYGIKSLMGEQLPSPMDQLKGVGMAGLTAGAGEAGGQIGANLLGKILSPFANRTAQRSAASPAVSEAQKLVEQGAPISPSQIADTKTSRFFEWFADKVWPASSLMAKKRQSLQPVAEELKDEFVASRGLYDTSKGGVSKAWDDWVNIAGGPDMVYQMPKTTSAVNEAMGKPFAQMGTFWKKHAATFAEDAKQGQITVQGIRNLFNTLNPTAAKGAERSARMKIGDAIMEDLSSVGGEEMAGALAHARELSYLNRVAGPLRAIFNQAKIEPTKAGDVVQFNPSKFVDLWNQKRGSFLDNKNYSPEDIKVIDKFADQMRALIPDLQKAAKFTPPTSLGGVTQFNLENPLAVGGAIYKYPFLAAPVGLDVWLANSLMSPTGLMRKFLTTGIKPPSLPFKMGIMKGLDKND